MILLPSGGGGAPKLPARLNLELPALTTRLPATAAVAAATVPGAPAELSRGRAAGLGRRAIAPEIAASQAIGRYPDPDARRALAARASATGRDLDNAPNDPACLDLARANLARAGIAGRREIRARRLTAACICLESRG